MFENHGVGGSIANRRNQFAIEYQEVNPRVSIGDGEIESRIGAVVRTYFLNTSRIVSRRDNDYKTLMPHGSNPRYNESLHVPIHGPNKKGRPPISIVCLDAMKEGYFLPGDGKLVEIAVRDHIPEIVNLRSNRIV